MFHCKWFALFVMHCLYMAGNAVELNKLLHTVSWSGRHFVYKADFHFLLYEMFALSVGVL